MNCACSEIVVSPCSSKPSWFEECKSFNCIKKGTVTCCTAAQFLRWVTFWELFLIYNTNKMNRKSIYFLILILILLGMPSKKKLLRRRHWSIREGGGLNKSTFFGSSKRGHIHMGGGVKIFLSHVPCSLLCFCFHTICSLSWSLTL